MRTEQPSDPLQGRRLLVAASGSIAAVKTPSWSVLLRRQGPRSAVWSRPVPRTSSVRWLWPVLAATAAIRTETSGALAAAGLCIELAEWAELVLVAPLSASTLARWTHGFADGLLASILLASECPILVAAAMNTAMWRHPGGSGRTGRPCRLSRACCLSSPQPACWPAIGSVTDAWRIRS